jgi:hypothetical protein
MKESLSSLPSIWYDFKLPVSKCTRQSTFHADERLEQAMTLPAVISDVPAVKSIDGDYNDIIFHCSNTFYVFVILD